MEVTNFVDEIQKTYIDINYEKAALILEELTENGYTVNKKNEANFELNWVDQSGEMNKEVTLDEIIIFAADQKYKKIVQIMDQLDDINTISIENLPTYCKNLSTLIKKEKELNLVKDVLVQTEHFKQLKEIAEVIPEKTRKMSR